MMRRVIRFFSRSILRSILTVGLVIALAHQIVGEDSSDAPPESLSAQRESLEKLNFLIGDWKGVGQPRRGSSKGAWGESGSWAWSFYNNTVALKFTSPDSKLIRELTIASNGTPNQYTAIASGPDQAEVSLTGKVEKGELVLQQDAASDRATRRITLSRRGDLRLIVLHESTQPGKDVFFRVAEVGSTRKGKRLALPGGGQPQCVVTGGLGTTEVSYNGQTYYVCCSGCKQAFDDDPQGIIKEYKERLKKERSAGD